MLKDVTICSRDLSPFEQMVLELVCQGYCNLAIAEKISHSEKVVENTISRSAHAFGIISDTETNLRVLLCLAYRFHYGDKALNKINEQRDKSFA